MPRLARVIAKEYPHHARSGNKKDNITKVMLSGNHIVAWYEDNEMDQCHKCDKLNLAENIYCPACSIN